MIITALLLLLVAVKAPCEHFQADLEKPILSADQPNGVYVSGEVITFTCKTTNSLDSISKFLLYQDEVRLSVEPIYNPERSSATFTTQANWAGLENHNYAYTCRVHRRNVESGKSRTVWINVIDAPEKPRLFPDRKDKVYVSDELITLNCTAANGLAPISDYLLYEVIQQIPVNYHYYSWQHSSTFTIRNTTTGRKSYHCLYTSEILGRNVNSEESDRVEITVVARPPKPRISIYPAYQVYVSDELVRFTCWTTDSFHSDRTFHLYNSGQQINKETVYTSQRDRPTFTVATGGDTQNDYYCVYTSRLSGRVISSAQSDIIKITVVDLPSLSISLASNSVAQGEDVTINCTSTKNISVGTFHLYKNGVQLNDSVSQSTDAENKSTTFTIQNVDPVNSGNYTCSYQLLKGGRYLTSAPSESVLLCVSVKSNQRWILALAVVVPAFMFVILGIYCWKTATTRRRRELSDGTRWTPSTNQARRKDRHEHLKSPRPNENASRTFEDQLIDCAIDHPVVPTTVDGPNGNIVYVDLKVIQQTKKLKVSGVLFGIRNLQLHLNVRCLMGGGISLLELAKLPGVLMLRCAPFGRRPVDTRIPRLQCRRRLKHRDRPTDLPTYLCLSLSHPQ